MEKTVITWSFENWLTVLLMVFLGGIILSLVRKGVVTVTRKTAANNG